MPIQRTVQPSLKSCFMSNYSEVQLKPTAPKMRLYGNRVYTWNVYTFLYIYKFYTNLLMFITSKHFGFFLTWNTDIKHSLTLETGKLEGNLPQWENRTPNGLTVLIEYWKRMLAILQIRMQWRKDHSEKMAINGTSLFVVPFLPTCLSQRFNY